MFVCCGAIAIPCASAQRIWQVQGAEQPLPSPCSVGTIEKKKELVFFPIFNQKKNYYNEHYLDNYQNGNITRRLNNINPKFFYFDNITLKVIKSVLLWKYSLNILEIVFSLISLPRLQCTKDMHSFFSPKMCNLCKINYFRLVVVFLLYV